MPIQALLAARGDTLLAGTDQGVYLSADQASSWQHVFGEKQVNGFTTFRDKLYAALSNGAMMSWDGGKSWSYIYGPHALHGIASDRSLVYAMTLGVGLLRTSTDGQSWENANMGLGTLNLYTFEVKPVAGALLAGQWYGIYHSTSRGTTWRKLRTGGSGLPDSTASTTLKIIPYGILAGIGLRK